MIRFAHTVFAMPFALLAAVLAAGGLPSPRTLLWIVIAMVGARSAAMSFNRIVDHDVDSKNPRTASRELPSGVLTLRFAVLFCAASAALFVLAAAQLNRLCLLLSPVALAVVLGYSLTKRFTSLSHLVLGLSLAIAPVGAWIAVTGAFALLPIVLALAVVFWVAGFDVIYSLQDEAFDRGAGAPVPPGRSREPAGAVRRGALSCGVARPAFRGLLPGERRAPLRSRRRPRGGLSRPAARDREARRPFAGRRGVLHGERLAVGRRLCLRRRGRPPSRAVTAFPRPSRGAAFPR